MKTIRVIIAFLSIYLFVSALLTITAFGIWLTRYFPDSSPQEVAQVLISPASNKQRESSFTILHQAKGTTCLLNTITRASNSPSDLRPLLAADTTSLTITFKRFRLHESFVPLGYSSIAQLYRITNAEGKTLYSRPEGIIDSFFEALLRRYIYRQDSTITLVAQETLKTYTITVTTEGVISHED